jgi:hypothetical protein
MAHDIRAGKRLALDEAALRRHEKSVEAFISIPPSNVVLGLLRVFRPAILFLSALLVIWLLLRVVLR